MDEFIKEIKELITKYDSDTQVSDMVVRLAIETFEDLRNYPSSYSDEKKLEDMKGNTSKIAMASIEIDSKNGVENQTVHNENGTNRTYSKTIMAYSNVIGFANVI